MSIGFADQSQRQASSATCPFCSHSLEQKRNACPRCGHGSTATSEDIRAFGDHERRRESRKKGVADLFFLFGLLLGGPLISLGVNAELGLHLCLGGALASVARRYTDWSHVGTLAIGALAATVVGAAVFEPENAEAEGDLDPVARREMVALQLGSTLRDDGVRVEARGPELVTLWFYMPAVDARECGDFPPPSVRRHLSEIGYRRVVLMRPNDNRGLCSFRP